MLRGMTLAIVTTLALLVAGCVAPAVEPAAVDAASALDGLFASATPLWVDPQNAPHPAFNWPTLTNPGEGADVPALWNPITAKPLPEHISGIAHVAAASEEVVKGAGIALFGSMAIVPGYGEPSKIVDITDPESPKVIGILAEGDYNHRGAVVIPYPDGRLVTAFSNGAGFDVWDITDPTQPAHLLQVEAPNGGHKIGVVPGTPIIYNAHSGGGSNVDALAEATTEIYDLSDPANPVLVQEFANGYGCHHIYFWIDAAAEKYRATCAGIEVTQIWDIADPLDPSVVVTVPVHHGVVGAPSASIPIVMFSHFAILNDDGTVLIVGDEMGGGSLPSGCDVNVASPMPGTIPSPSGPFGNLWFYDVSDETNPVLQGWISPSTVLPDQTSCTAHHGRLVPDPEGRDLLAMSFYGRGVVLVDFTNPTAPWIADSFDDGTDTWETWYYNGYLFTGDLKRGLDVLTFE